MPSFLSGFVLFKIRWRRALLWVVATRAPAAISILLVPDIRSIFGASLALLMLGIALADARAIIIPDELTTEALIFGVPALALAPSHTFAENCPARGIARRGAGSCLSDAARRLPVRVWTAGDRARRRQAGWCPRSWFGWLTIPITVETAAFSALSVYLVRQLALGRPARPTARFAFEVFFARRSGSFG
jgi:hypothetical protein